MVMPTSLNITSYVHCFSCFNIPFTSIRILDFLLFIYLYKFSTLVYEGSYFQNSQSSGTVGHSASHDLPTHSTSLSHDCSVYKLHANIKPPRTSNANKSRLFLNNRRPGPKSSYPGWPGFKFL